MRISVALLVLAAFAVQPAFTQSTTADWYADDWCLSIFANSYDGGGRTEDSAAELSCGRCSVGQRACLDSTDCLPGQICIEPNSKIEAVWWDDRTDAAVNDLATIATTQDNESLYFVIQLWVSPDPLSLPFFEIAIDAGPGGIGAWHDPLGALTDPGHCSTSVNRACTTDADCHFCAISTEELPSLRPRTCGSGCNPDIPQDICDMSQTCVGVGSLGPLPTAGANTAAPNLPDYLILLDVSRYLILTSDSLQVMKADAGGWSPVGTFSLPGNPMTAGESIPAVTVEFAIPWSAFGCVGCPFACDCPDFGPGRDFRMSAMVARGTLTLDFSPDGPIEDVLSEAVAGMTTTTPNSCPGPGTTTTACELADQSQDAFFQAGGPAPGGRIDGLVLARTGEGSVELGWSPSCSAADGDYEVYEGSIDDFTTHAPVPGLCTTGGSTTALVPMPTDSVYYLVVPSDGSTEGSYGETSDNSERSPSNTPCKPQRLGNCPGPDPPLFGLSDFGQVRSTLDNVNTFSSDWGSFDLSFIGSDEILYFNLVADGEWRVRNLPILSTEGDGVVQTQTINFRVLPDGDPLSSSVGPVDLVTTLTTEPEPSPPTSPRTDTFFLLRLVVLDAGETGESLTHTTAENLIGGAAAEWTSSGPMPNQEVGLGESVPAAISNSLIFLDETHGLNIPGEKITVDALKSVTGWTASGAALSPTPWWELLASAFDADPTIPVTTTTTQSFDQAIAALQTSCGVVLRAPGHATTVRGVVKLVDGDHAIVIEHDTRQDWPSGARREVLVFDDQDGLLHGVLPFDGKVFDRFVVVCPE